MGPGNAAFAFASTKILISFNLSIDLLVIQKNIAKVPSYIVSKVSFVGF